MTHLQEALQTCESSQAPVCWFRLILVIPGGPPSVVQPLIETNTPELDLIRKFAALPARLRLAKAGLREL
jgi:hypothetical protein